MRSNPFSRAPLSRLYYFLDHGGFPACHYISRKSHGFFRNSINLHKPFQNPTFSSSHLWTNSVSISSWQPWGQNVTVLDAPVFNLGDNETVDETLKLNTVEQSHGTKTKKNNFLLLAASTSLFAFSGYLLQSDVSCEGSGLLESENLKGSEKSEGVDNQKGFLGLESLWNTIDTVQLSVASGLDWIQGVSGAPWWLTLMGATLAVRCLLLPLTLKQVKKSAELARLGPSLPPPFPIWGSGQTMREAWRIYSQKSKELGAPSLGWLVALPLLQIPLFITWLTSLRRMALSGHPGFETGGALWFTNLTEPGVGVLGFIFPALIGATYLATIQVSFRASPHFSPKFQTLFLFCKWVLQFFTFPAIWTAYLLPQGTHMYWLANSVFSLTQAIALRSPRGRSMLGLPPLASLASAQKEPPYLSMRGREKGEGEIREKGGEPDVSLLNVEELVMLAATRRAEQKIEDAIHLLELAVKTDESYGPSHVALGQLHFEQHRWKEASFYFKMATKRVADPEAQLLAHFKLGLALANQEVCERGEQGRREEAMKALEEATRVTPPSDPTSVRHHGQALVAMASLLNREGRKKEALGWLKRAVVYDPNIQERMIRPLEKELEARKE